MPNPPNHPHRCFLWPCRTALLIGLGLLGFSCSSEQIAHYRVPKEAPSAPSSPRPAMPPMPMGERTGTPDPNATQTPNVPPPPTPKGALKWSLPEGWSEIPGGGMRFATFKSPYAKLEATVVVLPGPAGGELANVNRWRGQIGLPGFADEASLAKARTVLKTRAGTLNVYDFTSTGQAKSRLVAGSISTPDGNTWFLKLTGDAIAVAKAKPEFMTILGSLHLD